MMVQSEKGPLLDMEPLFPTAPLPGPWQDKLGRRFPQAIAHRGYRARFPENTLSAFAGALEAGAHALETDIHLSGDGVVVLSHDPTLQRCFGQPDRIIDCKWSYLSTLRTLKEPHEPLPRLVDLLRYLARPGLENIWLLLDIKIDNNVDDVMRLMAQAIQAVPPSARPWNERIVLGCWAATYLPFCYYYLPGFPVTHIGYNICHARQFFKVPNVSFNMLQMVLMGPTGSSFLKDARAAGRPVFAWTVNDDALMRWSIRKGIDGVITDDPKQFLDVCSTYDIHEGAERLPLRQYAFIAWINLMALLFSMLFRWKHGFYVDRSKVTRGIPNAR
ncbi:MAG: hypothetical protein M1815_003033 [Lichina confinis]|nr:MAG: hypothetical protein M1815_003033 [Lichina confinis]